MAQDQISILTMLNVIQFDIELYQAVFSTLGGLLPNRHCYSVSMSLMLAIIPLRLLSPHPTCAIGAAPYIK
jgi:hypothetical protein